jgi:hypothetical protein
MQNNPHPCSFPCPENPHCFSRSVHALCTFCAHSVHVLCTFCARSVHVLCTFSRSVHVLTFCARAEAQRIRDAHTSVQERKARQAGHVGFLSECILGIKGPLLWHAVVRGCFVRLYIGCSHERMRPAKVVLEWPSLRLDFHYTWLCC